MNIKETVSRVLGKVRGEEPPAPDALTLIRTDHREVDALFAEALGDDTPSARRRAAIGKIVQSLTVHAQMEEAIFYPALRKAGGKDERDSVLEAAEEHGVVKDLIAKIEQSRGRDETLTAKVTVLKELVHHHVGEEEGTIFDEAKDKLGDERLQQLGEEMQRFKERALKAGRGGNRSAAAAKAARGTPSAAPRETRSAAKRTSAKKSAGTRKSAGAGKGSSAKKTSRKAKRRG
jgi:hemerythrin superfamily protein